MRSAVALRTLGVALAMSVAFVAACSLVTDLRGLTTSGSDASADGSLDAPPLDDDFAIRLTPAHVTTDLDDPGTTIGVTIVRGKNFNERVSFKVTSGNLAAQYLGVPQDVDVGGTTTSFQVLTIPKGVGVSNGVFNIVVTGTPAKGKPHDQPLTLLVGSQLPVADGGTITIPDFAYAIDVKAWGAGGGGGYQSPPSTCGSGGAGGFASARFVVTPNSTLVAVAGAGGLRSNGYGGGGGGGFSGLRDGTGTWWLIAGAGGGGGMTGSGGAGGGASGGNGGGCGPATGGSQVAGGVGANCGGNSVGSAGSSLDGGDGRFPSGNGAAPGGGRGGQYGGGGGGGYFGGGGGAGSSSTGGGGGGGSAYVMDGGADAAIKAGTGKAPFTTDPDYAAGVGVGGDGTDDPNAVVAKPGGSGRVVVRLAKP